MLALGIVGFVTSVDASVVNAILPIIGEDFRAGISTIEWTITIYLLVTSGTLLSFGRLGDLHGHRPVYLTGVAVFTVSSALCAAAPSEWALIACRAVQALGGSMIFANSPAILTKAFPSEQRGQALGMAVTMTYIGLSAGPAAGGWLASQFGWRSVFFVNVPICLVALLLSYRFVPRYAPYDRTARFDIPGAVGFTAGLVALLFALNQGHAWGWTSPATLGATALGVVLLAGFVWLERRARQPMLDLALFRSNTFSAGIASAVCAYVAAFGVLFLLPFYLIQGRGLGPAETGLILTSQPIIMAIVAPFAGTLSDRIGTRLPASVGMTVLAIGLFTLSRIGPDAPISQVVIGLAISGLGNGIFTSPNNSAILGSAPGSRQGIASGVLATGRNVGMVLGVGLAGAVLTTLTASAPGDVDRLAAAIDLTLTIMAIVAVVGAVLSATRERVPRPQRR